MYDENMQEDSDVDDDYFENGGNEGDDSQKLFEKLLTNRDNRDIAARFIGKSTDVTGVVEEELEADENGANKGTGDNNVNGEEEEDAVGKGRSDLVNYQEFIDEYTEKGQMDLLSTQISDMQRKKFETRDKIKKFMDNTFDPVTFSSISRLISVESVAYHQAVFEKVSGERGVLLVLSCMTMDEIVVCNRLRSMCANLTYNTSITLLKVASIFIKEIIMKHSESLSNVTRERSEGTESHNPHLTSYEVVCLFYCLLFYFGFVPRIVFLLSFDKLNLDAIYRLDMMNIEGRGGGKKGKSKGRQSDDEYDDSEGDGSETHGAPEGKKPGRIVKKSKKISKKRSRKTMVDVTDGDGDDDDESVYGDDDGDDDSVKKMMEYAGEKGIGKLE